MRSSIALFLFPLVALSACEPEPDATERQGSATESMESADRPAPVSDPNRARTAAPPTAGEDDSAVAEITPTEGNDARGTLYLSTRNGTVQIAGTIRGLESGAHGFHIHEVGDCSAPDASSAGDHFNPHDDPHGSPRDLENAHHVGDLGNLTVNEQGEAQVDVEDNEMQLSGPESVVGKAIVVHADQDDFETQPSGNSGAPVGCGEIVAMQ